MIFSFKTEGNLKLTYLYVIKNTRVPLNVCIIKLLKIIKIWHHVRHTTFLRVMIMLVVLKKSLYFLKFFFRRKIEKNYYFTSIGSFYVS